MGRNDAEKIRAGGFIWRGYFKGWLERRRRSGPAYRQRWFFMESELYVGSVRREIAAIHCLRMSGETYL